MIVAQITDLHARPPGRLCNRVVDTNAMLARAMDAILRLRPAPDVVIATGDLVDAGRVEEYRVLRAALARLDMPVYLIPGNHDRREPLREVFADHAYLPAAGRLHYVIDEHPIRLIALDTHIPGATEGEVGAEQRAWLDARLGEAPERPTIVFMHHPPFPTGIGHMDAINCTDGAALAEVIARHPQVERVLCGHHHRPIQIRWAGTIGSIAPSTAHQVTLDLRPGAPARFQLEPPSFHLHAWMPGAGIVTHQAYIDEFAGPYPFAEDESEGSPVTAG
ncbi:MAG: phosphodiesterase [Alphaproteobacteria bacterium]|nr:phosphodiesterase [Alphaproteobacteria bacterium]